jgi:hypothetical protein
MPTRVGRANLNTPVASGTTPIQPHRAARQRPGDEGEAGKNTDDAIDASNVA